MSTVPIPKAQARVHIRWMIRRNMPEVLAIEHASQDFPWCEEEFLRVLRQRNRITTEAPRYRDPWTGQWLPALILPDELGAAIAREVHRIVMRQPVAR